MKKRILFISQLIKGYNIVLDIGSDHGLVLKNCFDLNYIKKGIVSDNKKKPLLKSFQQLKNYPVSFYLSDGFDNIKEDFDLSVICGMGPYTISSILEKIPIIFQKKHFLLGPQGNINYLIKFLYRNNFCILRKYCV
ncbi:MAG: tRNA (adenine(22)-N(1))-methyltransferase TrmK, partial [Candidatus Phytoplasma australasiaticum]|nr:tRNA (adenine(22)-N(1))-methyltransferase TrmK [Candidatus Phytoplasma australasiaticum]